MESAKEIFREFCNKEKSLPLFFTYGWLETVAPGNWEVIIEKRGGEVAGILSFVTKKKWGLKLIELPSLTPYGGIWINYPPDQKYSTRLSYEKEIFSVLIEKLPSFDSFNLKFYPGLSNWLPFFWKGYTQTTAYTYIIENLTNEEYIFSEFKENIRREIRKAEKSISISPARSTQNLYQLKSESYHSNKLTLNIGSDYINRIYQFCCQHNCGEILEAKDKNGQIHAAAFFVKDRNTTYYLFGASSPQYKNSGAMSLLMWEAIKRASKDCIQFNFEGSMIEGIENFFRSFGGKQVPYFVIRKTNSRLLKLKEFLKNL